MNRNWFFEKIKLHFFNVCTLVLFFVLYGSLSEAQCINTYPNTETFETAPVWTVGGNNIDWTWGTPSKPVITGAGGGLKCWCIGGLTASFYNYSEQAYILSSCYDFTSLTYPHVTFKIFWESEHKYDGGNLQYSITGAGGTWINVGAYGNPVDCMNDNWYNYANITYLNSPAWISPNDGWCGNIQATVGNCQGGNGSAGWVVAKHCLNGLAGQPNVLFRFTFGAGTTCNNFDGLAIDDFTIENGMPNAPDFTFACSGNNTLAFTSINPPCPTPSTYQWDFGDPASGPSNTSAAANPSHTFSSSGTYTVTLTTSGGPCNPPGTISKIVSIMSANIASQTTVSCFGGNNGSSMVNVTNGTAPLTYSWSPSGGTSQTATGLSAGTYTITVTDAGGCMQTETVSITQPTAISLTANSTPTNCNASIGTASVVATGGAGGYSYSWNPSGQISQTATALNAGTYTVTVNDANGCTKTQTATVTSSGTFTLSAISTLSNCTASNGTATANSTGGTSPYTYSWNNGQTTQTATGLAVGTYTTTATDANGCTQTQTVTVNSNSTLTLNISSTPTGCTAANGTATAVAAAGTSPYTYNWSNGQTNAAATALGIGTYTVIVTDANGCIQTQTVNVSQIIGPSVTATATPAIITTGASTTLTASGGSSYLWSPSTGLSCATCSSTITTPLQTTVYCVTVTDINGCNANTCVTVDVELDCSASAVGELFLPNAFSPDQDGENDFLKIYYGNMACIKILHMQIYDRWGEKVFETDDKNFQWDGSYRGKIENTAVFVYYLKATLTNGQQITKKGNISLMK